MCYAKWKQVTLHLHNGYTHSCHHPAPHKIPLEEIEQDVSALHNTNFKKSQRKLMLKGEKPSECDYCWRTEESSKGENVYSDRITKSLQPWANRKDEILQAGSEKNINPSYLEVSFSNSCNFKCSYCSPEVSSTWMEEVKKHGGYPTSTGFNNLDWIEQQEKTPIPQREHNPYVEAFWKWWPDLYPDLHTFRITGGEPLMTRDTFKVLDYIQENPNPNLELSINSNLVVPDALIDKLIEKAKRIQGEGLIREFKIYTSCDAHGKRAEYIRNGLDYNKWLDNCYKILDEIPQSRLVNMATYNALSVTSFQDFMTDFLSLRKEFNTGPERRNPVNFDVSYLRWPPHQAVFVLDRSYLQSIEDTVTYMYRNKEHGYWPPLCGNGFYDYEINKMQRIHSVFKEGYYRGKQQEMQNRRDFASFVDEHDRRRGTSFLETFPEMEDFYFECKSV
jgi:organic radical activating enzyme